MGDSSGASGAAARRVQSSQQGGVLRRLFELMVMLVSALLVIFAWDTAGKAREESAQLRLELRRAKRQEAERSGTRCTVCLDNPREVLLQPCGHVCLCMDCSQRIASAGNQCPICREDIVNTQKAYIA